MEPVVRPQHKGTKRLFNNNILEKLTHTHIAVPLVIFFLYAAGLLYWSLACTDIGALYCVLLFFLGFFVFTWAEYNMHRYLFHLKTDEAWKETFQYTIHGVHHEFPKDKSRLAMPPLVSVTLATMLLWALHFFIGGYVFAFLPGFLIGYAFYLFIHYIVHVYPPPKNIF
ncbi:MAG: fatty acid hydroxylase, partial [Candidatus Nephrothrix sp. EaCA]